MQYFLFLLLLVLGVIVYFHFQSIVTKLYDQIQAAARAADKADAQLLTMIEDHENNYEHKEIRIELKDESNGTF